MTCNQLILLLDVRRGHEPERHVGTLDQDISVLRRKGLVEDETPRLTAAGEALCNRLLHVARQFVEPARQVEETVQDDAYWEAAVRRGDLCPECGRGAVACHCEW